jgi:hypothetical protein
VRRSQKLFKDTTVFGAYLKDGGTTQNGHKDVDKALQVEE